MVVNKYFKAISLFYGRPSSEAHKSLADEVACPSPSDQLPIEKNREAPVRCLPALIWLSGGGQSICDTEKVYARHF